MEGKVVVVDWTYLQHQSIYSRNNALMRKENNSEESFIPPSTFTCMSSLIGALKKIGISDELNDVVILAVDGRHSWRKDIDPNYKSDRKEQREKATFVDWNKEYEAHNNLLDKINDNLPFFIAQEDNLEADDIIAVTCKFFSDKQVIIVSPDKDFNQLLTLENTRIWSPHPHPSVKKCPYKILDLDREKEKEKAYKELMKKIRKETSDNLVSELMTEQDYDNRRKIIDLLQLPDFVIDRIKPQLEKISNTEKNCFHPEAFSPGIQKKLQDLYNQDSIITWEDCYKKMERKLKRKKKEVR